MKFVSSIVASSLLMIIIHPAFVTAQADQIAAVCGVFPWFFSNAEYPACYSEVDETFCAQIKSITMAESGTLVLSICENTTIDVGIPGSELDPFLYVDGVPPLTILRDDVTIQCGIDGNSSNGCKLNGGWVQLTNYAAILMKSYGVGTGTTNNLKIKGLTFTGELKDNPFTPQQDDTAAISLSAPAEYIVIEDIVVEGLTGRFPIVLTDLNAGDGPTIDVTIQDSIIRNVTYSNVVVWNNHQTATLRNVHFQDIKWNWDRNEGSYWFNSIVETTEGGTTTMIDCSFDKVELGGPIGSSLVYFEDPGAFDCFTASGNTKENIVKAADPPEGSICDGIFLYGADNECKDLTANHVAQGACGGPDVTANSSVSGDSSTSTASDDSGVGDTPNTEAPEPALENSGTSLVPGDSGTSAASEDLSIGTSSDESGAPSALFAGAAWVVGLSVVLSLHGDI